MTITGQLDLSWKDAWLHEGRNARGEWTRGPGGMAAAVSIAGESHGYQGKFTGRDTFIPSLKPATNTEALTGRGRPDGTGTADDPIDVQGNIDRAVLLMAQGKHVRLNQVDEISTLMSKVNRLADDYGKHGLTMPKWDMGKISVAGTNLFTSQTKGIPRIEMPQLSGPAQPGSRAAKLTGDGKFTELDKQFRDQLHRDGISVTDQMVPTSHLRATQRELTASTVAGIARAAEQGNPKVLHMLKEPLWVSRDNYIIDGHHRWAAQMMLDARDGVLGNDTVTQVHRVNMDIGAVIPYANQFAQDWGIAPVGLGNNKLVQAANTGCGLDLAFPDAPGFTGQGWHTQETVMAVQWLLGNPGAWAAAMAAARAHPGNLHTVADTLHEQIVPRAVLEGIAAAGGDPAKVDWLEVAHELIERRHDPLPVQEHTGVAAQAADLAAVTVDPAALGQAGIPVPGDKTAVPMFVAHRLDDTLRGLAHATERMKAAQGAAGDLRGYHCAHLTRHLTQVLDDLHGLTACIREHFPAEAAELEQVRQDVGLAKALSPQAKAATTAHLLETTLHETAHAERHAAVMGAAGGPDDLWAFNAEHCGKHLGGAVEHAGKLAQQFTDNYPDVARWLAELDHIASPDGGGEHARYSGVAAQLAAPMTVSGQMDFGWEGWRTEPRDSHGRWTRGPGVLTGITAQAAAPAVQDAAPARKAAARPLHSPAPGILTGDRQALQDRAQRVNTARQRALVAAQAPATVADIGKAVAESKIYSATEMARMQAQLDQLQKQLAGENLQRRRAASAVKIGIGVAGIVFSALTAGVGLPVVAALAASALPVVGSELADYHVGEKGRFTWLQHPVTKARTLLGHPVPKKTRPEPVPVTPPPPKRRRPHRRSSPTPSPQAA